MLTGPCQTGIGYCVLIPPPLYGVHTVSDTHAPTGPLVVNVVPPTSVIYGVSPGNGINPLYAPESPDAA
jgi:hypothetical protein